ncbi:MAG: hypothetical protein EOP64_00245 [Sphingomonas sp.]|nr:MAG: hypothetical protein EOP64_00245 [Sphingomonas sp.]
MRYLANRPLHIRFPGQPAVDYKAGDELPDFGEWPFHLQERFLENRLIRTVEGSGDSALTPKEVEDVRRLLRANAHANTMGVPLVEEAQAMALGGEGVDLVEDVDVVPVNPKDFVTKRSAKAGRAG